MKRQDNSVPLLQVHGRCLACLNSVTSVAADVMHPPELLCMPTTAAVGYFCVQSMSSELNRHHGFVLLRH
jgi:hypothetical protein